MQHRFAVRLILRQESDAQIGLRPPVRERHRCGFNQFYRAEVGRHDLPFQRAEALLNSPGKAGDSSRVTFRRVRIRSRQFRLNLAGDGIQMVREAGDVEDICQQLRHALAIALAQFGNIHDGSRHQPRHRRRERVVQPLKHLVGTLGKEHHPILLSIVKDSVIISPQSVAVPVTNHQFHREKRQEAVHIQGLIQPREPRREVRLLRRRREVAQAGLILGILAGISAHGTVDVHAGMAVVNIAFGIFEVAPQKLLVDAFDQDVKAQPLAIQLDRRVRRARSGDAGGFEEFPADLFREVSRILHGIIQVQLFQ